MANALDVEGIGAFEIQEMNPGVRKKKWETV